MEPTAEPRQPPDSLLLRRARVWARPEDPVCPSQDVLLSAGRIEAIGAGLEAPGAREVDLGGRVVTAGLWNCHVHFSEPVWRSPATAAEVQGAMDDMVLRRGFTTVVDLGSDLRRTVPLREAVGAGRLRGPRILTAGAGLLPWRGFPFYLRGSIPWYLRHVIPTPLTATGARRVLARQRRLGSDVVKLFTGSYVAPGRIRHMRPAVARAACEAAHRRGAVVLAHPSDRLGVEVAVRAGVDVLAHLPDTTAGTLPLLVEAAQRGTAVIPTLHLFNQVPGADARQRDELRESLRNFLRAGGRVLFGTDVGFMRDRRTLPELEELAACGMSAADILRCLTVEPARRFSREGAATVAAGSEADLTVFNSRATVPGPEMFADVHMVVRGGRVVLPPGS